MAKDYITEAKRIIAESRRLREDTSQSEHHGAFEAAGFAHVHSGTDPRHQGHTVHEYDGEGDYTKVHEHLTSKGFKKRSGLSDVTTYKHPKGDIVHFIHPDGAI